MDDTTSTGLMIIPSNPPPQRGDNHLLGTDLTSPFKFEIEFKDVILVALRDLGFSHSLGPSPTYDALTPIVSNRM